MYPVSSAFLEAIKNKTRRYYWSGQITTKSGSVYQFDENDILKGSGSISMQCSGSNEIELGTVYSSEFNITLLSEIDRYTLEDATVEVFFNLLLPDETTETVPMGIFEISEANRTLKHLEIKAYDYMLRFDKDFNGFETIGKPYDFLSLCSVSCDVELAQSQEEIEALPNGEQELSIYSENDIESYRDVLFYVAQVLGCFCVINREGKLELRRYSDDPVLTVEVQHRFSSSFSDFITRYTAVSSTNMKTETAEYYHLDPDDGLTMNLGVNPLLQFGLDETRQELCTNILNDIAVINYVPFDSDTIGNPALDLGDVLRFSGGHADVTKMAAITAVTYKIGGRQTIKCVGKNPRLAKAKSKNDKNISGLLNQIEAGKIGIHTFTNASAYTIADVDTRIIRIEFATTEANHAQFFAQIIVDVSAEAVERTATASGTIVVPIPEPEPDPPEPEPENESDESSNQIIPIEVEVNLPVEWTEDGKAEIYVTYFLNNFEILEFHPEESWHSGKHILSLYYPIEEVITDALNTFEVYVRMSNGSGAVSVGDCIASISGQSMAAAQEWDGKIEIEEQTEPFRIAGQLKMNRIVDEASLNLIEIVYTNISDSMQVQRFGAFGNQIDIT